MPFLSSEILRDLFANRPAASSAGRIFFASDTGKTYRDNGTGWDDCSDTGAVSSVAGKTGAVTLAESDVTGLVSDLAAKAPLASPTFTGTPAAPTPATSDNSTTLATTAFVKAQPSTGMSNPMTTQGDLIVGGSSGTPSRLAAGSSGYVLTSNGAGATPSWAAASSGGGGYTPGTVPTVVQVAYSVNGGNSATFSVAPTSGNLLVAMCSNPASGTAGSGWTNQAQNTGGTDFYLILTKVAGAGESTTQSPMSGVSTAGGIVIWEINGQNGTTPFLIGQVSNQSVNIYSTALTFFPNLTNCLGLACVAVVSGQTISSARNLGTQDVLDNSGTRCLAAGHTDLSKTPTLGVFATFNGSANYKAGLCLITS